jgi:pilus assembly protein CpaE
MGLVRETLAAEAVLPSSSISYQDAVEVVKRSRPDVCIVGIGRSLDAALALAQSLSKEAPSVTLVALAASSSADVILSAMRVGYKEYVVLPNDAARLRQVVHDAAYAPADDDEKGLVISVAGSKGGVGTTLICTHLAAELAAIHRVICLDMDFSMGDAATMLDLTPKDNLIDLLPRADRLDERMLTGSISVHRSKVHVLAQPNEIEKQEGVNPDDVYAIIRAAAKGYQYVLIDVGIHTDAAAEICFAVSDIIVLVATPDVISVRDAFRRLKLFERLGIEKERVRLVVNRESRQSFVTLDDIQQNLQIGVSASISDDPKTVDSAINEGKLLREINRKAEVARDISSMVAIVTEDYDEEMDDDPSTSGGGFFSSLFGR